MTMSRIIWHHTGGPYSPTGLDLAAYHLVIDGEGRVQAGRHAIEANAPGRAMTSGSYAAHTKNLNSGSIGISLACMAGAQWGDRSTWRLPTLAQIDSLMAESARLCLAYGIEPGPRTTLSHAEVEITLGVKQSGKWDFDYSLNGADGPRDPRLIGDGLRAELRRVIQKLSPVGVAPPAPTWPVLRRGASGFNVRELQKALSRSRPLSIDGQFGPATHAAVVAFQRANQLLPDGIVGPLTWAALART